MSWWEIIGWAGSVLVVVSLMVPSVRKFRILNLTGSFIATIYNVAFAIWPYAAMNAIITIIDAYWLVRMRREGERRYSVCPVDSCSSLVTRFIERHGAEMTHVYSMFRAEQLSGARTFLTLCDDEVIGLFAYECDGTRGRLLVDYVTDRFRDLKPGRTLYAAPAIREGGIDSLVICADGVTDTKYFAAQGFVRDGNWLIRNLNEVLSS